MTRIKLGFQPTDQKPWRDNSGLKKGQADKYQTSWKGNIVKRDDTVLDYQDLSDAIRPANTIYKERTKTDYFKSKDERDDDDEDED